MRDSLATLAYMPNKNRGRRNSPKKDDGGGGTRRERGNTTRRRVRTEGSSNKQEGDKGYLLSFVKGISDPNSLHQPEGGEDVKDFVRRVFGGFEIVMQEYLQLKKEGMPANVTFEEFKNNAPKNRYIDIKCYDQTRVILKDGFEGDYIHANYVDGYKQCKAYIATQGPLATTYVDFWRMIWQEETCVIGMVTKIIEQNKEKCGAYWPKEQGKQMTCGHFVISCKRVLEKEAYCYTELAVRNVKTGGTRPCVHLLYLAWPDCGVPLNSNVFLGYLDVMRKTQHRMMSKRKSPYRGHPLGPPVVVHCSAGIGRTGTLCAVDICCRKLLDVGTIDVQETVRKLRKQRFLSVQKPEQYMFICLAVIQFAIAYQLMPTGNYMNAADMKGLPDMSMERPKVEEGEGEYGIVNYMNTNKQ